MHVAITVESPVVESPRVAQIRGLFDLPPEKTARLTWAVRRRGQQFVAVTCHDDVEDWLQPDWTYRPAEGLFQWRCLRQRPPVALRVVRCAASAWALFAPHHYLSGALARSAVCFLA